MPNHLLAASGPTAAPTRVSAAARCCRSSASCAATWPAPAGRNTSETGRRLRHQAARRPDASPTSCPSRSSRRPPRPTSGHDENIDARGGRAIVGAELADAGRASARSTSTAPRPTTPPSAASSSPTPSSSSASTRRRAHPDRRGADARLLALLAGRPVRARPAPAELRQAVRARLPAKRSTGTRPRPARSCRPTSWPVPGNAMSTRSSGSRASRSTTTSPTRRSCSDEERRSPSGRSPGSSTRRARPCAARCGTSASTSRRSGSAGSSRSSSRRRTPSAARARGRADVRAAARESADRDVRDRDRPVSARAPRPRIAVVTFPGSNDDRDAVHALDLLGADGRSSGTPTTSSPDVDAVVLPGGFSYGDYLRCGAIARFAPIMDAVRRVRRRRRAGARHLQRLPDPLRGRNAARRPPPERVALVRLSRRAGRRRERRDAVHVAVRARAGGS